ncbi:hypothetical protein QSJ18_03945 [Gordonia sp. ABSL1-1]|uniref:hypothetical protein n=1 Tax=Gordonia sp. ABSL1-1 TaxID=3053923 RepID=UPI002572C1B0|nr:hypothetical protein [Gordonia sp. ABSL1-1]MDL9935890.1 hypothetical protein [Gordonia sp. ABSL1-1]
MIGMQPSSPSPQILISPAMGVRASFYRPLCTSFERHGWSATVVARRGLESGDRGPSWRSNWSYADEAAALAVAVSEARIACPGRPVLILGHSLGAQLCALLDPAGTPPGTTSAGIPDGIVLVAGSVPWARYYAQQRRMGIAARVGVPLITSVLGYWPRRGFGGPTPRTLMREWARMVATGRLPGSDAPGPISLPTFAVRLHHDRLVPPAAAAHLERHFRADDRTVITHGPDAAAPEDSLDHLGWVRTPDSIVDRIAGWWSEHALRSADIHTVGPCGERDGDMPEPAYTRP